MTGWDVPMFTVHVEVRQPGAGGQEEWRDGDHRGNGHD